MNNITKTPKMLETTKKDKLLANLLKLGMVILFFGIAIGVYMYFFNNKYEKFQNATPSTTTLPTKTQSTLIPSSNQDTIYERALKSLFPDNQRLICSMIPGISNNNICQVNGESYIIYNFPVQMIKLPDGGVLAVFNDGRLYKKDNI